VSYGLLSENERAYNVIFRYIAVHNIFIFEFMF